MTNVRFPPVASKFSLCGGMDGGRGKTPVGEDRMDGVTLYNGDCLDVLKGMEEGCVDAVVCDPPYGLEFMGKEWDRLGVKGGDIAAGKSVGGSARFKNSPPLPSFGRAGAQNRLCRKCGGSERGRDRKGFKRCSCELPDFPLRDYAAPGRAMQAWHDRWAAAALRVLKPAGYMLSFGGTRTFHRLACAIEDAGFELRDTLCWLYGTGFPKGKGCLKPSWEPILLARKPGKKVLPLGIDGCRIGTKENLNGGRYSDCKDETDSQTYGAGLNRQSKAKYTQPAGRWPANVAHDGSEEVLEAFAEFGSKNGGHHPKARGKGNISTSGHAGQRGLEEKHADTGTAARFYYCAKASRNERGDGNTHPTVKPLALIRWLVKLVTPPTGVCLDPFLGSGTTALACIKEGRRCIGIEKDPGYFAIAKKRIADAQEASGLFAAS